MCSKTTRTRANRSSEEVSSCQRSHRYDDHVTLATVGDRVTAEYILPHDDEDTYRTKAVLALVSEVVPGGELANVESQLPEEFEELFELVDADAQSWESYE